MKKLTGSEREYEQYIQACRYDFSTFVAMAFKTLYPNKQYHFNWHIEAMADSLECCLKGDNRRLVINMPPRMLKSFVTSVAYPAWVLGQDPSLQIMCISYGDELVKDIGLLCQTLMHSENYRRVFPNVSINKRRNSYNHIQLNRTGGCRMGITAGGAITGRGADIIIIDDPLKASDARTKERESINQWFDDNVYQRLNNKNKGIIILVMQRLHQFDLSGHIIEKPEIWEFLELPAIADEQKCYQLPGGLIYERKEGEVLCPQVESLEMLNKVKANLGTHVFSAQYQQQPSNDRDAIIKLEWLNIINRNNFPHQFSRVVQSWDTANKLEEQNDYSVGITIGMYNGQFYVIDVIRARLSFPELITQMERSKRQNYQIELLVEDAASGQNAIQAMRAKGFNVKSHKPVGDKFTRLCGVSGIMESKHLHLPHGAPWLEEFLKELTRFPSTKHDDQVDALSQGLQFMNIPVPRIYSIPYIR